MFNLRIQVFLAFLFFTLLLTLGLFFYSRMSFEHSFTRYMEQKEAGRNARLISALSDEYQLEGSWEKFKNDRQAWERFVSQYLRALRFSLDWKAPADDPGQPGNDHHDKKGHDRQPDQMPPPQAYQFSFGIYIERFEPSPRYRPPGTDDFGVPRRMREPHLRYILLDKNQRVIAGYKMPQQPYFLSKIQIPDGEDNLVVGYLGTPINPALRDLFDNEFVDRQQNHFIVMTLVALAIALLCAVPLSHLLTQRVKALARHVQLLSLGRYNERIATRGHDEIATLGEHLNHLAHTLEQSEQTRKRWVADISHELRTPLAVLQADLEALEDGVRRFDQTAVSRLQKHAARLTRLVNDLYELSLTDIGALSYRKQDCELTELLAELSHSLEGKFAQVGLEFTLQLPQDSLVVFADPQRLQQLFLNLLNNSMNYTQSPGQVLVTLEHRENDAVIEISDSAPGVETHQHEKLFERLYRAESSRSRETGGAGLGLSICRNIVQAHNGTIHISNSEFGGLKVRVQLPLQPQ